MERERSRFVTPGLAAQSRLRMWHSSMVEGAIQSILVSL